MAFLKDENMYDVIVVGVGSMGSCTCYYLAQAGLKVLGIDQFSVPHEKGSHTGESRFVRMAYFEHPDYVPLLKQAYRNWDHIEAVSGANLFHKSGLVYFGLEDCEQMKGIRNSASLFDLKIEEVNESDSKSRFPQFTLPKDYQTIYEANAGFAIPEKTIETYIAQAKLAGAEILENTRLESWVYNNGTVDCITSAGKFKSKKIVFTSGGWTQELVRGLKQNLQVTQQSMVWFKPRNVKLFRDGLFGCWSITDPSYPGMFYGFPIFDNDNLTMKIAYHTKGIEKNANDKNDTVSKQEMEPLDYFFDKYMPGFEGSIAYTKTCLYNYSQDEDFIIDKLSGYDDNVIIACGFSGHGFKFVPLIGEVLKDLVVDGKTAAPIEFLKLRNAL